MPSGPGVISDELIKEIVKGVPKSIKTFLLTSEKTAKRIARHHELVQTSTIQIVDHIDLEDSAILKQMLPTVEIVQVIHV